MTTIAKRTGLALLAWGFVLGSAEPSMGYLVTYRMSGTISATSGPAPAILGERFVGFVTYDDSVSNQQPGVPYLGSYNQAVVSITIETSASLLSYGITDPSSSYIQILHNDDINVPGFYQDAFSASVDKYYNNFLDYDRIKVTIGSVTPSPSGVLSSNELQGLSIDLDKAAVKQIAVTEGWRSCVSDPMQTYVFWGQLDSFDPIPVPEPTSLLMCGLAGVTFSTYASCRRKRV